MNGWLYRNWKTIHLYHRYYKRTGLYRFVLKNVLKILTILISVLLVFYLIERYIIDFESLFTDFIGGLSRPYVLSVFLLSETFLGLIPPDFFIIWSKQFPNHLLMLTYLALLSYLGGIIAYQLGQLIRTIPRIQAYVNKQFNHHFIKIKKWGGVLIIVAALFPLPYASISMVAGIMRFPFNSFILFGLTRILRFYVYAFVIFQFM